MKGNALAVGANMWLVLKWRVMRQCHMDKPIRTSYIPTAEQVADVFSKDLCHIHHEYAVALLGMYFFKQKAIECGNSDVRMQLVCDGEKVPLIKCTGVHEGAKDYSVCNSLYDAIK
jgi:hypothetical protein